MTAPALVAPASLSMLLAMVDMVKHRGYLEGSLGVYAQPGLTEAQDVTHDGQVVRIRPAASTLAAREALLEHVHGDWLVIVTDRDERDLGAGVLAHFVGSQLRRPDAWEAVRQSFSASGVASSLSSGPGNRAIATALLACRPPEGWPPAPAGVLTRSHAMTSVARAHLGLVGDVIDTITVLSWSVLPQASTALADLRDGYGDAIADAMIQWIADATGPAGAPVGQLLAAGAISDLVPLGIALNLLSSDDQDISERQIAGMARVRLEPVLGKPLPHPDALAAHGAAAVAVLADLSRTERNDAHVGRILTRADAILTSLDATALAVHSDELASGFRRRLALLAEALRQAVSLHRSGDDTSQATAAIESAWALCARHRLAQRRSSEARAFGASVKLWRWLISPRIPEDADLATRVRAHLDHGAWADDAVNDVDTGVDDKELTTSLNAVFAAAKARREQEERGFARCLATSTAAGQPAPSMVWNLEDLLASLVIPMARRTPVLFVVMDGMSAAASNEIVADVTGDLGWVEAGTSRDATQRAAALAVLPSLTNISRTSLLCGALRSGAQDVERSGYLALTGKASKIRAELFHKKGVDTTRPGALVAEGVGAAIDDGDGIPLVTVVLNTIDDALDRSDPVGTVWNADAVKHLAPLLSRARAAGRTVVMTADHGHVVERRHGTQRSATDTTSGRSRGTSAPAQVDEVLVEGRRVLTDDHRAVLAVDESLRYGPLKAGYHGGASAQEVVVPVIVLLPDEATNKLDLPLLPPQAPTWWTMSDATVSATTPSLSDLSTAGSRARKPSTAADRGPTLFDEPVGAKTDLQPEARETLGARVVASEVYASQRTVMSRLPIRDEQVRALIDALAQASGQRMTRTVVATTLGVPAFRVDGALSQVRQILNIEGYTVIALDPDGQTIVLDTSLLRDQFGVR